MDWLFTIMSRYGRIIGSSLLVVSAGMGVGFGRVSESSAIVVCSPSIARSMLDRQRGNLFAPLQAKRTSGVGEWCLFCRSFKPPAMQVRVRAIPSVPGSYLRCLW